MASKGFYIHYRFDNLDPLTLGTGIEKTATSERANPLSWRGWCAMGVTFEPKAKYLYI